MSKITAKAVCDCGHRKMHHETEEVSASTQCAIAGCVCREFHQQLSFTAAAADRVRVGLPNPRGYQMPKHPAKNFKEP